MMWQRAQAGRIAFPVLLLLLLMAGLASRMHACGIEMEIDIGLKGADQMSTMSLTSKAFAEGQAIPRRHTGDGENTSPPLAWTPGPENTMEYALICDDADAPTSEPWVHWVVYGIPATMTELPEGKPEQKLAIGSVRIHEGLNSFGNTRYGGPAPPRRHGVHHYHFRIYALDHVVDLPAGASKDQVLREMRDHVLAKGELMGTYER